MKKNSQNHHTLLPVSFSKGASKKKPFIFSGGAPLADASAKNVSFFYVLHNAGFNIF